jgi:hypothetical protein
MRSKSHRVAADMIMFQLAAISKALKEWNDSEALRLLRRNWDAICRAAQAGLRTTKPRGLPSPAIDVGGLDAPLPKVQPSSRSDTGHAPRD